ncbi:MAG: triose-phosphate isomerase [Candidatus Nucleicultricaceae bacterium]
MKKKYVFANWKMNNLKEDVSSYLKQFKALVEEHPPYHHVVICPPHIHLEMVAKDRPHDVDVGGQDCSEAPKGAYTGDISAAMLKDIGAAYVLIGHSERRQHHGENKALLQKKMQEASKEGLCPVLCVGETLEERESNRAAEIIRDQLSIIEGYSGTHLMIAYEPVWAIGTGRVPNVEDVDQMHQTIEGALKEFGLQAEGILYGGSVTPQNASFFLSLDSVGGVLVGGASLNPQSLYSMALSA